MMLHKYDSHVYTRKDGNGSLHMKNVSCHFNWKHPNKAKFYVTTPP